MAKEIKKTPVTKKTVVSTKGGSASGGKKEVAPKIEATPVVSASVAPEYKIVRFVNKNAKISPRKLRLLANEVKKMSPSVALTKLSLTNTNSARILAQAIKTLVSVAKNNYNLTPENLKFDSLIVEEGQKIKRMDKSHGSHFARGIIIKRHSRLVITVKGLLK